MRAKEECNWCMSTQHIIRDIDSDMPEEYKHRCSACHELWREDDSPVIFYFTEVLFKLDLIPLPPE